MRIMARHSDRKFSVKSGCGFLPYFQHRPTESTMWILHLSCRQIGHGESNFDTLWSERRSVDSLLVATISPVLTIITYSLTGWLWKVI